MKSKTTASKKKTEPGIPTSEIREIYCIVKNSMRLYSLVRMEVSGDVVLSEETLKKDLPMVIVSQLMLKIKSQGFVGNAK